MLQDQLQNIRKKTKQNMEYSVCQVILLKETMRRSLCLTDNDVLAVSTLLGEVALLRDFININCAVIHLIELSFKSVQSYISCRNVFLVSFNAAPGGVFFN